MALRSWKLAAVAITVAVVGVPSIARSQCAKDTDCKGARICSAGQCVDSTAASPPRNWALAGGIVGSVGAGITMGFSIPMEFDMENPHTAQIALAGTAMIVTIVAAPIAAGGGHSARRLPGVEGERGARAAGWLFYILDLMSIPGMVFYSVASSGPPPHGWITAVGFMGALSQSLLAADAFIARSQALKLYPPAEEAAPGPEAALAPRLAPYLSPVVTGGGMVAGVAGSF
jgi:hypothetical protein